MIKYELLAQQKVKSLKNKKNILILAIESSCDETSVAVVKDGRDVLSNIIYSQLDIHKKFGGVVPEIASRKHLEVIDLIIDEALKQSHCSLEDIDAVGVTYGPGLVGALLVGVSAAKAISYSVGVPLIGVNHIEGHINAALIAYPELEPPFISLITSGGHTQIVIVNDYCHYTLLGRTRDDAVGEAFDKVGRVLGLPYPGGPEIEAIAKLGNPLAIKFPSAHLSDGSNDFSFSGIKTSVINYVHTAEMAKKEINISDIAASFQHTVVKSLSSSLNKAITSTNLTKVALAGGVAANKYLQQEIFKLCIDKKISFFAPPAIMCTDNAAMIGCAAYYQLMNGNYSDLSLNAAPNLRL